MENKNHKIDRGAFSVVSMQEQEREAKSYWKDKTSAQRLEALETIRQMTYGYNTHTPRLQRVLEIITRP